VKRKTGEEWEPSATKDCFISFVVSEAATTASEVKIIVGGKTAAIMKIKLAAAEKDQASIVVPPKTKVKVEFTEADLTIESIELL